MSVSAVAASDYNVTVEGKIPFYSTTNPVSGAGTVSTALTGNNNVFVGGLIGNTNGTISNSYSTLNVGSAGNGNYVGGLVGQLDDGVVVDKCYTKGTVAGRDYVGGISGRYGFINNCVALGAGIIGGNPSNRIGRIVGGDDATLTTCYAIITMTLTPPRDWINTYDGTSVTDAQTKTASNWETAGYSKEVWNIEDDSYPTLNNSP